MSPFRAVALGIALFMCCGASMCVTATPEPKIITKTVTVPVPVSCTVEIPAEPVYADSAWALHDAPDILSAVKLLLIGRLQRMNVIDEQKAALSGCGTAAPATLSGPVGAAGFGR